jgi:hypothetical protein
MRSDFRSLSQWETIMGRLFLVLGMIGIGLATLGGLKDVLAAAGKLNRPEIAAPPGDETANELREALLDHKNLFAGGSYINAHSTLNFKGDARKLSRMLEQLCAVEGAAISIRFSQNVSRNRRVIASDNKPVDAGCQWSIDHNGWADAGRLSITILVGDGGVDLEELELPAIRGRKAPASPEKAEVPEKGN